MELKREDKKMKRLLSITLVMCSVLTLSACNQTSTNNITASSTNMEETVKPTEYVQVSEDKIVSNEPIVIAETTIYDLYNVQIVMKNGNYRTHELSANPNVWYGDFSLRVLNLDEVISEQEICFNDNLEIAFPYSLKLHAKDLNQDGALDIAIGQYIASGKVECKLYSVDKEGVISELNMEESDTILVAGSDVSPEFEVTEEGKVKYPSFGASDDVSGNEFVERYLVWEDNKFVKE